MEADPEWNVRTAALFGRLRLGEKDVAAQRALVEDLLSRGPEGDRLIQPFLELMIRLHEKETAKILAREITLDQEVSNLKDAAGVLRSEGLSLEADPNAMFLIYVSKGKRLTLSRLLAQRAVEAMIDEERQYFSPEGATLRLVGTAQLLEQGKRRLAPK
jgi:hypothetical protein